MIVRTIHLWAAAVADLLLAVDVDVVAVVDDVLAVFDAVEVFEEGVLLMVEVAYAAVVVLAVSAALVAVVVVEGFDFEARFVAVVVVIFEKDEIFVPDSQPLVDLVMHLYSSVGPRWVVTKLVRFLNLIL